MNLIPPEARKSLGFHRLYDPHPSSSIDDVVSYLESACKPAKSLPSESSHYFLINDASSSIRQYLGLKDSNDNALKAVLSYHIYDLEAACSQVGCKLRVVSIPEKYSVYPEYLPDCLSSKWSDDIRTAVLNHPSIELEQRLESFVHLGSFLRSRKPYGDLFYHGDTHTTSLGSLHILRFLNCLILSDLGLPHQELPNLYTTPMIGSWLGDLAEQANDELKQTSELCYTHYSSLPRDDRGNQNRSYIIHQPQILPPNIKTSNYPRDGFSFQSPEREKTRYINDSPVICRKLLVFRDSTATDLIPSLALAFSEVISIWDRSFVDRIRIIEIEKPDMVIVITADRFVCSF